MQTKAIPINSMEVEEIEDTVREHLAAFGRGDFDAWGAAFAPDIFFTAADPEEVFSKREDAVAEMHKDFDMAFDEGLQIEIEPLSFHTGISLDGDAAWTVSPLRYGIHFQGETNSFVLRHSSVLTKSEHGWSILATHYSLMLPEEKVLQALTTGDLPAPHLVGDVVRAGAHSLVDEFKRQLADFSTAAVRKDVQIFGPFLGEQAEGESSARSLFAKWGTLSLRPDGIRAQMVSSDFGWLATNVEKTMSYEDQQITVPLRALEVYQREEGHWGIVHAHISVGIPDELAE